MYGRGTTGTSRRLLLSPGVKIRGWPHWAKPEKSKVKGGGSDYRRLFRVLNVVRLLYDCCTGLKALAHQIAVN